MTLSKYIQALQNSNKRQRFLDNIKLGPIKPLISSIEYNPIFSALVIMDASRDTEIFGIPKTKITVYPLAFDSEYVPTYNDFLSCLIDHEGTHAFQNLRDPLMWSYNRLTKDLPLDTLEVMTILEGDKREVEAYENQLANANLRGISDYYRKAITSTLKRYQKSITHNEDLLKKRDRHGIISQASEL